MYYAARRLSPHYGKAEGLTFARLNEKVLSLFRRFISMTSQIENLQASEEQKSLALASFIAYIGFHLHFPMQAFYFAMMSMMVSASQTSSPAQAAQMPISQTMLKFMDRVFRNFASNSLRLMLFRMMLKPLHWNPISGPRMLIDALKTNLYVFSMGDFGSHIFTNLVQVDYQEKLGPIYSGYLKPMTSGSAFFGMHAIVVIGARERAFMVGEVYFVDPHDASGPGIWQKVYVITLKDFFTE